MAGRPAGSVEDPNSLSLRQLISDYKFYRQLVDKLRAKFDSGGDTLPAKELMEIATFLQSSIEKQMKYHLSQPKAGAPPAADSAEVDVAALLDKLIEGGKE